MISLLDTDRLLNPLPHHHTSTSTHHRACFILDEYDKEVIAHIKAFPAESKALANEIAGHLLYTAANINTAPRAWVILLTSHDLSALFPDTDWGENHTWPCWATQHIEGLPINNGAAWTWADQLAAWSDTAACIAIAEWLWETDGNAGNLINIGNGEFAAIDFADILGGSNWTAAELLQSINNRGYNKLLHIAWGGMPTVNQSLAAQQHASQHNHLLNLTWPTIRHWWQCMLKKKELTAALEFMRQRAAANWMGNRL